MLNLKLEHKSPWLISLKKTLVLGFYNTVLLIGLFVYSITLVLRGKLKKFKEVWMRFMVGCPEKIHAGKPHVWLNAVSVGEVSLMIPLINDLLVQHKGLRFVVTTSNHTSENVVKQAFGNQVAYVRLPWDFTYIARKFVRVYNVKLAMFSEGDLWPAYLKVLKQRKVPTLLLNGRMSPGSYRKWSKARYFIGMMLDCFTFIAAESVHSQQRLQQFTNKEVCCFGSLKTSSYNNTVDDSLIDRLKPDLQGRKVLLACSTHKGEEKMFAEIHSLLKASIPNLLTIILPRHIDRVKAIYKEIYALKLQLKVQVVGEHIMPSGIPDIWLVEMMGKVPTFCAMSDIVYIGNSMFEKFRGGHNLLEPLRQYKPVVFGPYMEDFRELTESALRIGAAFQADSPQKLANMLKDILQDNEGLTKASKNSAELVSSFGNVKKDYLNLINKYLPLASS